MEIISVNLSSVEVWNKNLQTRATKTKDYERTKKQILELGIYEYNFDNPFYAILSGASYSYGRLLYKFQSALEKFLP